RARGVLTRIGYASGVRDAKFARRLFPNASDSEVYVVGPQLHNLQGIVNVHPEKFVMDVAKGICDGEFIWEDSYEANVHRDAFGIESSPCCWMQVGYATGYTSELFGDFVLYEEIECLAKGDKHCRIIGKPLSQWHEPDPLVKYFEPESVADRLLELQTQVESLRASVNDADAGEHLIGESASFKQALALVEKAAPSQVTLMLLGETGVGKEMFARELHRLSNRSQGPFVTVNCAAIPEALLESELFGVEKGAFTGVSSSRPGRFERAHGGTLFLDEVSELSSAAQAKLLRVLQDGEIERVGDIASRKIDVRVVVATNTKLETRVESGAFRADLLYRLNPYPVLIPPLRERLADIPLLADYFLKNYSTIHGKKLAGIDASGALALSKYAWPGNVREMKNVIERGVILTISGNAITGESLFPQSQAGAIGDETDSSMYENVFEFLQQQMVSFNELEKQLLHLAVERSNGNLSRAARTLGLSRPQLAYRLTKTAERS
ncbi:MAG: sigma 54-interacting transcriptional regulator, partial [Pseudomonadota bacterium]